MSTKPHEICLTRCIIIDDDEDAIEILAEYISGNPSLKLVKTFNDPLSALNSIDKCFDLVFMDIDMPRLSGLDLSSLLKPFIKSLVFTTAHPDYALAAFDVHADGYLLKPISLMKFTALINKIQTTAQIHNRSDHNDPECFYVKSTTERNIFIKLRYQDIVTVESLSNYIRIATKTGQITTYLTLKEIKATLEKDPNFIQVHRSFIVSQYHIESIDGNLLKMSNNTLIQVGNTYRDSFFTQLEKKIVRTGRY